MLLPQELVRTRGDAAKAAATRIAMLAAEAEASRDAAEAEAARVAAEAEATRVAAEAEAARVAAETEAARVAAEEKRTAEAAEEWSGFLDQKTIARVGGDFFRFIRWADSCDTNPGGPFGWAPCGPEGA